MQEQSQTQAPVAQTTQEPRKTRRQLKTERREAFFNGVQFVYGWAEHRGQKLPTVTVAIVPEMQEDNLYFGVAISRCNPVDINQNRLTKLEGRSKATARARAVLKMDGYDILGKPDHLGQRRILAMRTHWEDAPINVEAFNFSDSLAERVMNSIRYLTKKLIPEVVEQ